MTVRRLLPTCVLTALALLTSPRPALAQLGLPAEVVSAPTLSDAQRGQVRQHVTTQSAGLSAESPLEIKRSRDSLLNPLDQRVVSVAFRQEYSNALAPVIEPLTRSERELVVVNALRLAGELATPAGAALLTQFVGDQRDPVRYAAVSGIRNTLQTMATQPPAITPDRAQSLLDTLVAGLRAEQRPHVLDAYVRALAQAAEVTQGNVNLRPRALTALAQGMSERLQRAAGGAGGEPAPQALLETFARAGEIVRNGLTDVRHQLPEEARRAAAEFGGDLLAFVLRGLQASEFPVVNADDDAQAARAKQEQRALATQLVSAGAANVIFATRFEGEPPRLAEKFRPADEASDREFVEGVRSVIGPGGILSKPPFSLPAGRFIK